MGRYNVSMWLDDDVAANISRWLDADVVADISSDISLDQKTVREARDLDTDFVGGV